MSHSEPPDWALPAWDAVGPDRRRQAESPTPDGPGRAESPTPDRRRQAAPASASTSSPEAPGMPGTFALRILHVSEVTRAIRGAVRQDRRLGDLWVEGEVGRVTISSAGHAYFALKDERSQLQCVWFREDRARSAFEPRAGLRIVAHGRVDLFEPQGALQLYVESIQPAGLGDLALRFEALKARLAAEGLFDTARKRQLPVRPSTIAVVTSPTGAVWRDICHVLARRWPLARVVLVACQVQGETAPASVVTAFRRLERHIADCRAAGRPEEAPAVTILARGGGSLEDLWPFNDERVVRAVVGHPVPVVCGVGHEVDVTLADFAADVRAPTPSAAAEVVVPDRSEFTAALRRAADRLASASSRRVAGARRELDAERRALAQVGPAARLAASREQVGLLFDRATRALAGRLARDRLVLTRDRELLPRLADARLRAARARLDASAAALGVLGPQATLDRGYAIVRRRDTDAIVRDPTEAPPATAVRLTLARGELAATVDETAPADA